MTIEKTKTPSLNQETVLHTPYFCKKTNNAPWKIRTPDLLIRSQTLYPAELRAQNKQTTKPCGRRDSNPHSRNGHKNLNLARLPNSATSAHTKTGQGGTRSRTGDRGFADLCLNRLAMPPQHSNRNRQKPALLTHTLPKPHKVPRHPLHTATGAAGIEPTLEVLETSVLPLNYAPETMLAIGIEPTTP